MEKNKNTNKMKNMVLNIILLIVTLILLGIPVFLVIQRLDSFSELKRVFSSLEEMRAFIGGFGRIAPIIFFLLQTMQIIAAPIPGNVTALVGGALFGFWPSFLITVAALATGSTIAFLLVKRYGRPLVERFVDPETIDKYLDNKTTTYSMYLFLLFLLPFFPDDALCFIAGLTKIKFRRFFTIALIARPPGLAFSCLAGSGAIMVPWWGWAIIAVASVIFVYSYYRWGQKIENWLQGKFNRKI